MTKEDLIKLIFDTWLTNNVEKPDLNYSAMDYALQSPEDYEAVEKIAERLMAIFANSVPTEPTKVMWGDDLVRVIIRWMREGTCTPKRLYKDMESCGIAIPDWMVKEQELAALDHVVSKGTCAVLVYKAMLDAHRKGGTQ
jgi:hypothetical protein